MFEFILDSLLAFLIILIIITPKEIPAETQPEGIYKRETISKECIIECWRRTTDAHYQENVASIVKILEKNIDKNDLINCNAIILDFQDDKNLFGFIFCDGLREIASHYFNCGEFVIDKLCLSVFVFDQLQEKYGKEKHDNEKMGGRYRMEKYQKKKLIISFMEK